MRNITDSQGFINSVYPPMEYLTFGPWIYMVPQYKCEDALLLGYAGGTVAGLLRTFYGAIPITGVDVADCQNDWNVQLVKADAREYVKTCRNYDAVIVDIYEDGQMSPPAFVHSQEFADDLKKIARYIIVHTKEGADMSAYGTPLKVLSLNDSRFYYYMVYEIPTLPIR